MIYYDRTKTSKYAFVDSSDANMELGQLHGIGNLNSSTMKIKTEDLVGISPKAQYRTQLILDKNSNVVGVFCRLM